MLPVVILHWNRPDRCVGTVARFLRPGRDRRAGGGGRQRLRARRGRGRAQGAARRRRARRAAAQPRVRPRRQRGVPARPRPPEPGDDGGSAWPLTTPTRAGLPGPDARRGGGAAPRRAGLRRLRRRRHTDRRSLLRRHPGAGDRRARGGSPPATRTARCCWPGARCSRRWGCSTSATSPTARRPTWPSEPRRPAGRPAWSAARSSCNPDLGTRVAVIDYLQLRNTLLLVREHSGRYHAFIRGLLAVGQLLAGLASPARRGPYLDPRARVQALVDHARGRYGAPPLSIQDRQR